MWRVCSGFGEATLLRFLRATVLLSSCSTHKGRWVRWEELVKAVQMQSAGCRLPFNRAQTTGSRNVAFINNRYHHRKHRSQQENGKKMNTIFIKMSLSSSQTRSAGANPILPCSGERARALSASSNAWICLSNFSPLSGRAWMFTAARVP